MRQLVALSLLAVASGSESTGDKGEIFVSERMPSHPIYLGEPAQFFSLGVSTSTNFVVIPCEGYGEDRPSVYSITKSNYFTQLACDDCRGGDCIADRCAVGKSVMDMSAWTGFEAIDYGMAGTVGDVVADVVGTSAAKTNGFELSFVCETTARGYFKKMNGIVGLTTAPTSFLGQMHLSGKIDKAHFSLCFNENTDLKYSNDRGLLRFGGYVEATLDSEMVYASRLPGYSHRVNIKNIFLRENGGNTVETQPNQNILSVALPSDADKTMILDTSIPFLTLDIKFEEEFKATWLHLTGHEFTTSRQDLTLEEVWKMPTLLIELEGAKDIPHDVNPDSVPGLTEDYNVLVAIPAIHYMEHMPFQENPFRTRINFDSKGGSIFGLNAMTGHTVSYEADENRIGFAETKKCSLESGRNSDESYWRGADGGKATTDASRPDFKANAAMSSRTTDDDIFATKVEGLEEAEEVLNAGVTCFTASCRSLMAMGYVFIGTALAVVYRVSRPKERYDHMMAQASSLEEPHLSSADDDLHSAYRRKPWSEPEAMLI